MKIGAADGTLSRIETLFTKLRHQRETNWWDSSSIGRANHFQRRIKLSFEPLIEQQRSAAHRGKALIEG
jgi:hypothetical protein